MYILHFKISIALKLFFNFYYIEEDNPGCKQADEREGLEPDMMDNLPIVVVHLEDTCGSEDREQSGKL